MKPVSLAIVTLVFFCAPALAGDPSPQPSLCEIDSPACRNLAIGVAKLELDESIHRRLDQLRGGSLLCPEDKPNCCPEPLMPYCARIERQVVAAAQQQFHQALTSQFDDPCLWTSYCDLFGEESDVVRPPIVPDPIRPLDCPCGTRPSYSKGICVPDVCTAGREFPVPCEWACSLDELIVENSRAKASPPKSPLERHLRDRSVQLEAAKLLRKDISAALEAVNKEIAELSGY